MIRLLCFICARKKQKNFPKRDIGFRIVKKGKAKFRERGKGEYEIEKFIDCPVQRF